MQPASILVVDDDPAIRSVITFALEKAGHRTRAAGDGREALALFAAEGPDLIVLDIGMPEMDGFAACREIRKVSEAPILFLSARDEEIDRVLGLELGGDDYVTKPFSPRELVATSAIGFVFLRTITRPVRALIARTTAIAGGDRSALKPLDQHGTAEFAQLSQSFLDMATGLAARSEYVTTFAAHVSHELKSPLTAISGAAELLIDDLAEPSMTSAQRGEFLAGIQANADRLGALVARLRELARAETMPTTGTCQPAEVIQALREAGPKITIETTGEASRSVAMSAETLSLVLGHLVDNAAQAGAGRVVISAVPKDDRLVITVSDDGPGISPANRARIFDAFFTTRRADGGTGMGLSIARAMVAAHRGSLDLLEGDTGARFRIDLPATQDRHE